MNKIKRNKDDIFIYENEIRPWLPNKIFDAHSHLMHTKYHDYHPFNESNESDPFFYTVEMEDLEHFWQELFPDSKVNGHIMGMPVYNCNLEEENKFVAQSVTDSNNRFGYMTSPQMSLVALENAIKTYKPAVLKPYLVHAQVEDKQNASITDFITEEQLDLANNYGLAITLHVSKPRGMADKDNLKDISELIKKFPKCQFILAHCGRCFIHPNMRDALDNLPVAENLWVDTSAVCDMGVFLELFSRYDLSRIVFGSDLVTPVAFRGNYVRLGMSWHAASPKLLGGAGGLESKATFAAYENLSALLQAARFCRVSEDDIQNIFYNNSKELFKLKK